MISLSKERLQVRKLGSVMKSCIKKFLASVAVCGLHIQACIAEDALSNRKATKDKTTEARSDGKPIIHWYMGDSPPRFINDGPFKDEGYADKTYYYLKEKIPQFDHRRVNAPLNRALADMKHRDGICQMGMTKSKERQEFIAFTHLMVKSLPNRLIILATRQPDFARFLTPSNHIDLTRLISDRSLTAGVELNRHYSTNIDPHIDMLETTKNIIRMSELQFGRLLSRGRIDYTFGFVFEANYQFQMIDAEDQYMTLAIAGEPILSYGYVGCSKRKNGLQVVSRINALMKEYGSPFIYQHWVNEWLDEQALADWRTAIGSDKSAESTRN